MRSIFFGIVVVVTLLSGCRNRNSSDLGSQVKIIFDTDLGPDYDDVGALAILHSMADSGRAEILATISCNKNELVVPSIDVINSYFHRPSIPVGAPKTVGVNLGSWQHWADSIVAKYPHSFISTTSAPDALGVYRRILNSQPDNSVTIVTVGFLTNLANLLRSKRDKNSNLTGLQLIRKKVKRLVSMAGAFPEGKEFNIHMDSLSSKYVYDNWPGEVVFTGFEIGKQIHTGLRVINSSIENSPVKDVFRISIPMAEEDRNGRMSWDETAVIIGVYGPEKFFDLVRGRILVNNDGSNKWENDINGKQFYVTRKMPVDQLTEFIEDRMMHVPFKSVRETQK